MQGMLYRLLAITTNILPENWTIGVVIAGIQYLTARDNEAQVAAAKKRLVEVVIGLVAWAAMFVVLRLLIPGFSADKLAL